MRKGTLARFDPICPKFHFYAEPNRLYAVVRRQHGRRHPKYHVARAQSNPATT
jgi:hypothetical protein